MHCTPGHVEKCSFIMAEGEVEDFEQEIEIDKLKVDELKQALALRGLKTKGNKEELRQRLSEYIKGQTRDSGEEEDVDEVEEAQEDDVEDVEEIQDNVNPESDDEKQPDAEDDEAKNEEVKEPEEKPEDTSLIETSPDTEKVELSEEVSLEIEKKDEESQDHQKTKLSGIKAPLTDEERINNRMKRFGAQSSDAKIQARAARFGTSTTAVLSSSGKRLSGDDAEKIKRRAERFGAVSSVALKMDEKSRIERRKERFGTLTSSTLSSSTLSTSNGESEAKRKKRAERFGL